MSKDEDGVYPFQAYIDPSYMTDKLRKTDRYRKKRTALDCIGCIYDLGMCFEKHVCAISKSRDSDGFCSSMNKP